MDGLNCIFNRRSIRKYLKKPVEFDKIAVILKAGSKAPSAGNLQDYRFIVLTDKVVIRHVANHCTEQYWIAQAPVAIVVCTDIDRTEAYYGLRGQRLYSIQDAAAAMENMLLAAYDLGLGSCWIGSFEEEYISDALNIPDNIRPQGIITLGYADGDSIEREETDLNTMVYFNKYGIPIENMNTLLREYNKEIEKIVTVPEPIVDNAFEKLKETVKKTYHKAKNNMKNKNSSRNIKKNN